ncbi:cytochrome c peroxidase [Adhaeretor mobilis]|uniref:Cytochrome c551 peroxidase n=1 Tax=Adhaeretor mobilis TaxID=1930276 RepID=A0A517MS60_9BACT|nr:cytochrome c peroxidase [Adhaeretor mobilis]QDS97716.1 Cytochrome c551 peroxidase precursor [Adhaeretor mobilis]
MIRLHQRAAAVAAVAGILSLVLPATLSAETVGVPSLPTTPDDYIDYAVTSLPTHFKIGPTGNADNTPVDNPITNAGAALGRALFYDERLSHSGGVSCASCHQQANGFSDPDQFSEGVDGLTGRHSMGLSNSAIYASGSFFWDERATTLEDQVLQPIENSVEMGGDLDVLRGELAVTEFYPVLFQEAFGDSQITDDRISKALAQFVRSMASYQSKFDEAFTPANPINPDFDSVFTEQEQLGATIFHARGSCSTCHTTNAQVGNNVHNIGLDANNSSDEGAGNGAFKTNSLRNVAVRDGYMHDGRFSTLEEVVEHYSSGIQNNPNLDRALPVGGFGFTAAEEAALVAFLETLTDDTFLNSELFSDPFVTLTGDYNDDGIVDGDDLGTWVTGYGSPASSGSFLEWQQNLGFSWLDLRSSATVVSGAVPEPSAVILLALGAGALTMRRGRRGGPP